MDIDRQAIERRDFPIARRGYDPAAVDAHLRALASEVEELARRHAGGAEASLATAAGSQVQSILQAAETAAADIEREAQQQASKLRSDAEADAQRTRDEEIAKARAHLAAVSQATSSLLARIGSLDGETSALLESLRGSAQRLGEDLGALDANVGQLYDAAAGQTSTPAPSGPQNAEGERASTRAPAADEAPARAAAPPPPPAAPPQEPAGAEKPDNGDLDGARLVALNMALSGESRAATERYLAEHFQLSERDKLIDEVYAAIEA
jgi:DivIVA domain-containing protein